MASVFDDLKKGLAEVDAFLAGKRSGYKVSVPAEVDVKSIRKSLHMTQVKFSDAFGFSIDAVKHWEGGRRTPESAARAFLTVIARNPEAVLEALHGPKNSARASARSSAMRERKSTKRSLQH